MKKLTMTALLAAVGLGIFVLEAQLPPLTAIPGIKPGLSHITVLFALYTLGPGPAFAVLLSRMLLGCIVTGQVSALLYSGAGGLLSILLTLGLRRAFPADRLWVLSCFSAMTHNLGQLLAARCILRTPAIWLYLPPLLLSGLVAGVFTGLCAQLLLRRLAQAKLIPASH